MLRMADVSRDEILPVLEATVVEGNRIEVELLMTFVVVEAGKVTPLVDRPVDVLEVKLGVCKEPVDDVD